MDFLSTYAAIRFATGRKGPKVFGPLAQAFVLIVVIAVLAPIEVAIWLYRNISVQTTHQSTRPTTHRGYPASFHHHVEDLREEMR